MLKSNSELRALTGLRGAAALTVALAHYNLPILGAVNRLFFWHDAAVDLFFCLSGFTLALVYVGKPLSRTGAWNYGVARFARIYPLYISSLLAMAFIRLPIGNGYDFCAGSRDFVRQVLMVNAWPLGTGVHWNIPAWSISVEWFCYLFVFPPLWLVGARVTAAYATLLAAGCMAVAFMALTFFFDWQIFAAGVYGPMHHPGWTAYAVNVVRGSSGFIAGWAMYSIYVGGSWLNRGAARATDAIVVAILALIVGSALGVANNVFVLFLFPALVLGLANEGSATARILASPVFHKLGLWSYSIYMLHVPTRALLDLLSAHSILARNDALYAVAALSALLAAAAASYRFFEVPWRRMLRDAFQLPRSPGPAWWGVGSRQNWGALAIGVGLSGATASIAAEAFAPVMPGKELLTRIGYIRFLREGWSSFEGTPGDAHVWGVGKLSTIIVDLPVKDGSDAVELKGVAFVPPEKPELFTRIAVNGEIVATIEATRERPAFDVSVKVPKGAAIAQIDLVTEKTASPKEAGLSNDDRELSVSLTSLRVIEAR